MANTQYITQENDRWDLIAVKAYGDCSGGQINILQRANPYLPITAVFKAGVKLVIPIIEDDTSGNIAALLPPWKRVRPATDTSITSTDSGSGGSGSFDSSFG